MIGPNKYVIVEDSLVGLGAKIIQLLHARDVTLTALWNNYQQHSDANENFERFVAAIDLLYIARIIDMAADGLTLTLRNR